MRLRSPHLKGARFFFAGLLYATVAAVSILPPTTASADESTRPTVAEVTVAGGEDDAEAFIEAMREPLESLGLRVRGAHAGGDAVPPGETTLESAPPGTVARVWVDARHADHVDILIAVGTGATPVRRSIPRNAARDSRAVVAEEIAYAARATLESMLTPSSPSTPPPTPPVAPTAAAPPEPPSPPAASPRATSTTPSPAPEPPLAPTPAKSASMFGLDTAALANVRGVASSTPAFGGGIGVDVAFWGRRTFHPFLWVAATIDAPFATETPDHTVSLETTVYSLRAVPGVELARVGPFRFAAGAGVGVDLFHVAPNVTGTRPFELLAATTFADPVLEAQLLARARLSSRVGLLLALTLDYDMGPHHYLEVDNSGVSHDLLAPWAVRPAALVGLCFSLTGPSSCAGSP